MAGSFFGFSLFLVFLGTALALKRLTRRSPPASVLPGIAVLKPLKGADPGLRDNLHSFFRLNYPDFELLFSVAEACDPAVAVVNELRALYPWVSSRLFVGAERAGLNPKVNNLTRSYRQAVYDLLLISDSNVRVNANYLHEQAAAMRPGVGVVTAAVAGLNPTGWGGRLEATYLNTFYARGMSLAFASGNPCVIGKSMLFHRSVAARFGGIRALSDYLAEDYALGEEMRKLGLEVALADAPIEQHIGAYSFLSFWDRHLRWGRIRKAHAPAAFLLEPLFAPVVASLAAGMALRPITGFGFGFALCVSIWCFCDLLLMARMARGWHFWFFPAWLAREALSLPMWLVAASGNSVRWRGSFLTLSYGGKIQVGESAWLQSEHSSGELLPARTRLRDTTIAATGGLGKPRVMLREG